jgi:tRNA (cytidine56-2'-O)-methyltransferase
MRVSENWGGRFSFEMGRPWKKEIENWKTGGGITVHLTAYGENIQGADVLDRIRKTGRDILLLVGSQKVPPEFYSEEVSDFNVSVGNQPHSECAAVAIFLDRFFKGMELDREFEDARMKIIPQERGKKILVKRGFSPNS